MRYHAALRHAQEFSGLIDTRHRWERRYTADEYLKLLATFSNHQALPEPAKTQFFEAIEQELRRFGEVTRHYETMLLLAHRAR